MGTDSGIFLEECPCYSEKNILSCFQRDLQQNSLSDVYISVLPRLTFQILLTHDSEIMNDAEPSFFLHEQRLPPTEKPKHAVDNDLIKIHLQNKYSLSSRHKGALDCLFTEKKSSQMMLSPHSAGTVWSLLFESALHGPHPAHVRSWQWGVSQSISGRRSVLVAHSAAWQKGILF